VIHALDSSAARSLLQRFRALDNTPADQDTRPDFVEWSDSAAKQEVALQPAGFVHRHTDANSHLVAVTQAHFPRWYEVGATVSVDTVCRSAQGAYSGWLGGVEIGPESQDAARKCFYAWQKPLLKPGGG
jgi:hypothetical protein